MPAAGLQDEFLDHLVNLQQNCADSAAAALNTALRSWQVPGGWSGNPLDINEIALAFARVNTGEQYGLVLTSELGSVGDASSTKLQSDYVASMERAYRLRHCTPVRCRLHAAVRRAGHANPAQGVFARVASFAQDLIVAGGSGFLTGN